MGNGNTLRATNPGSTYLGRALISRPNRSWNSSHHRRRRRSPLRARRMPAEVFNPRRASVQLSEHLHVQQESPLTFLAKVRGVLENVSAQKLSGRNRLACQVNGGLARQSQ